MYSVVEKLNGKLASSFPIGIKRKNLIKDKSNLTMLKNKYDSQKILNRGVLID